MFRGFLEESIVSRAVKKGACAVNIVNLRDFAEGPYKKVDDKIYGGGPGMLMMCPPWFKAVESRLGASARPPRVIMTSPAGRKFDQRAAEELAREAAAISKYRAEYIKRTDRWVKTCFSDMMGDKESVALSFVGSSHSPEEEYLDVKRTAARYAELLTSSYDREIAAGSTLWGIHKDDIEIDLNGNRARIFASKGQQRSLSLALKLAEGEIIKEECGGDYPVFLFDDVLSELDEGRRRYLMSNLRDKQVIL